MYLADLCVKLHLKKIYTQFIQKIYSKHIIVLILYLTHTVSTDSQIQSIHHGIKCYSVFVYNKEKYTTIL